MKRVLPQVVVLLLAASATMGTPTEARADASSVSDGDFLSLRATTVRA